MINYKMRLNKFLTGAVTATMVASAVVPVASAANNEFTDVPATDTHAKNITQAVERGLFKGYGDGTFKPYNNISRGGVAKVLANYVVAKEGLTYETYIAKHSLTTKVTPFSDVPSTHADPELFQASLIVKDAKIFTGSNNRLMPSSDIQRQQMAKVLVNGFDLKDLVGDLSKVKDNDKAFAEFVPYIDILSENKVTDVENFRPSEFVVRGQMASFLNRAYEVAEKEVPADPKVAKVESVIGLNATQLQVTFNEAVDETDAEATGKVTIQNVEIKSSSLSTDGKVLTLTVKEPINLNNATVSVEPITTKADAAVKTEKYVSTFTYKDVVAPTIASVEALSNGSAATSLTVKASEPIASAVAKVNGTTVTIDFNGTDTAVLEGLSLETNKTHTLELINLEDKTDNKTLKTSATFTVTVDATLPTAALTATGDKGILVTFSKSMNAASVTSALVNGVVKNEALTSVGTGTATAVEGSNNTQFMIPVTETLYTNLNARTLHVDFPATIKDSIGNVLVATTKTVTLTKDTVKPTVTGYNVVKTDGKVTAIEINFSEVLKVAAQGATAKPSSIVNENGVVQTDFLAGLTANEIKVGDKKVVYSLSTPKQMSGKYVLSFAKDLVSDQAETANKSDAFNSTIDFGQAEMDTETTFAITSVTSAKSVITVTFPEAVRSGAVANSATDLANYTLAGQPLPTGTTITLNTAQTIATIELPEESIEKTDIVAFFSVANIKNTTGTKTVTSYTETVAVEDNTAPTLVTAKFMDANGNGTVDNGEEIVLTFSEGLTAMDPVTDMTVLLGGLNFKSVEETAGALATHYSAKIVGKEVRIKLNQADLKLTLSTSSTINVNDRNTIIKDVAKNLSKGGNDVKIEVVK